LNKIKIIPEFLITNLAKDTLSYLNLLWTDVNLEVKIIWFNLSKENRIMQDYLCLKI
jgi:hypothetical protein